MNGQTVLLADDDRALRRRLAHDFAADGYDVFHAGSPEAVGCQLATSPVELLILGDFEGPGANARLLQDLRNGVLTGEPDPTPVLVLADDAEALAMLRCFDAGADDFRPKAITYLELRARVRALMRRSIHVVEPKLLRVTQLTLNLSAHKAYWGAEPVPLSQIEFRLLAHLAQQPERTYLRDELLRDVWGYLTVAQTRTVDAHACRLRRKLDDAGASGFVVTVRGIGYRLTSRFDQPSAA